MDNGISLTSGYYKTALLKGSLEKERARDYLRVSHLAVTKYCASSSFGDLALMTAYFISKTFEFEGLSIIDSPAFLPTLTNSPLLCLPLVALDVEWTAYSSLNTFSSVSFLKNSVIRELKAEDFGENTEVVSEMSSNYWKSAKVAHLY